MNKALEAMLSKYPLATVDDHVNALREILQELALCGLWRAKFFEHAAFYGGTALRVLYGLDRFSEDMDFSLRTANAEFDLEPYCNFMKDELGAWGFKTTISKKEKTADTAIESAFLKTNTKEQLLLIESSASIAGSIPPGQSLKIKIEVDTNPPPNFDTETGFLLQPIPFSVRVYDLPSLFAGKMHAVLCRSWKNRVKGRDWYDFVWYVARGTELGLRHLEMRMRQSGHFDGEAPLTAEDLRERLSDKISRLDIAAARADVERFVVNPETIAVWSRDFFEAVAAKVVLDRSAR